MFLKNLNIIVIIGIVNLKRLKCPYYAFSKITFHAVWHVVCVKVMKPTVHDK